MSVRRETFDKSKIKLSDEMTEDQEVLDSIEYLLRTSNQNLIDCDFFHNNLPVDILFILIKYTLSAQAMSIPTKFSLPFCYR